MVNHRYPTGSRASDQKMQRAALVMGSIFLLVGVLGFTPGFTTGYGQMAFAGSHSGALLLSVFTVSVVLNLVHVAFGIAGLSLARSWHDSRAFLVGGGVVYLLLWMYGLLVDLASATSPVSLNEANSWLHLVLGVGMFTMGVLFSGERRNDGMSHVDVATTRSHTYSGQQL